MGNATMNNDKPQHETRHSVIRFIIRFVVAALVLLVTSYFVPGFVINGYVTAIIAALVIAALDHLVERVFRIEASPFGKGVSGFIISAIIIYAAQYVVPGMHVTLLGAVIGAVVIGLIDAILPVKVM